MRFSRFRPTLSATWPNRLATWALGLLLDFFLQEVGPLIYNGTVADAQSRMQLRLTDLDAEMYQPPFTYWSKQGRRSR